jgi:3-hydroxybutyryl-CoA dehydratase
MLRSHRVRRETLESWYFEDFVVGKEVETAGRTITETDIVQFAGLSSDSNPIHIDAEFARQSFFGQRVAHGLLILSIASGLIARLGIIERTVIAFRELTWKFSQPVFIGDTLRVRAVTKELLPAARLGGGVVTLDIDVLNQQDKVVQKGEWRVLIKSRSA